MNLNDLIYMKLFLFNIYYFIHLEKKLNNESYKNRIMKYNEK